MEHLAKLEAKGINKTFGAIAGRQGKEGVSAIKDVSLSINDGEFVCLVGPSGCGKTTLLNILAGLDKPSAGEVILDGHPVSSTGPDRIMVFQESALFPWLKVIDNVEFGLKMKGVEKSKRSEQAAHFLEMMQLSKFADAYIYQLSGGMKQRVAIARALVMDPEVLLMDEPFAALDSQTRDLLLVELQLIWARTKKTIVFITHNIIESVCLGDRVVVFSGRPGSIKKEVKIEYKRPRLPEDEGLQSYYRQIVDAMRVTLSETKEDKKLLSDKN